MHHTELPDYEIDLDAQVAAIKHLEEAVIVAFRHHDRDLRTEVEKINNRIWWIVGSVVLVGAFLLLPALLNKRNHTD